MRSIADEYKTGTFELLKTMPLTAGQIVWGKFLILAYYGTCTITNHYLRVFYTGIKRNRRPRCGQHYRQLYRFVITWRGIYGGGNMHKQLHLKHGCRIYNRCIHLLSFYTTVLKQLVNYPFYKRTGLLRRNAWHKISL